MGRQEKHTKKLLVEGRDDLHVICALCEKHHVPETFDVIDCGGVDALFEEIPVRFKSSGVDTIGILIDADVDMKSRWDKAKSVLSKLGFPLPDVFPQTGLIVSHNGRRAGVWIMPDNRTNGMLEDFISFLIPKEDKLLPEVDAILERLENRRLNNYSPIHKSKARIHSWLAWQEDPGTPLGLSVTKKYLTTDGAACRNLTGWLEILFEE